MDKTIAECDLSALLKFTKEIDEENEKEFRSLESELESTRNQYNKVVEQNRSLQSELKIATNKLNAIQKFLDERKVLEPTAMYLKVHINKILESAQ